MLLAVDIGNSNTVFGLASDDDGWVTQWRVSTPAISTQDDWAAVMLPLASRDHIDLASIRSVAIGSVVPAAVTGLTQFVERSTEVTPMLVHSSLDLGISIGVDNPHELGADRIANAVAAWEIVQRAAIVVDLGTATKVEAIDGNGTFLGGAIAPGIGVTLDALSSRAARLFPVSLTDPGSAIGRNTVTAMQAGLVRGHLHMVQGLVADIRAEIGLDARLLVTGGHAQFVVDSFGEPATHAPNLTLDGIRLIHRRNAASDLT